MTATPPALPGLPLLGNALEFGRDRVALIRKGLARFGPVFSFRLGRQPVAVLLGPEAHQFFFRETDRSLSIEKPYRALAAALGRVGFLAPHEVYREQRPILHAPFQREKMGKAVAIMQRETQRWLDGLGEAGECDLAAEMNRLVQEIAGRAILGDEAQAQLGRDFWALYEVLGRSLDMIVPPHWPLPKFRRRDRARQRMRELLAPIIAERRRHPDRYDDFLQDFVNTELRSGGRADDETLGGLIRALMFAGHETTSGQAAWTLIELLRHPDFLRRVQAEIDEYLLPNTEIEGGVLRRLEHVAWAVREVERLHPSADMLLRVAEQEVEVGGYRIPQGWLLMVSAAVAHRLPDVFDEPERFDPLRFAPERQGALLHKFALIGFGGGTHKCAGMNFANNEMMVITALLFQQFELELLTPEPRATFDLGASRPERALVRYRRRLSPPRAMEVASAAHASLARSG